VSVAHRGKIGYGSHLVFETEPAPPDNAKPLFGVDIARDTQAIQSGNTGRFVTRIRVRRDDFVLDLLEPDLRSDITGTEQGLRIKQCNILLPVVFTFCLIVNDKHGDHTAPNGNIL
jgi:hypothetical protein